MKLITLKEYKDFYNLKKPDEDTKITMLIDMVSTLIQTYLNIDFTGGKTYTEVHSFDYDSSTIFLNHFPVDPSTIQVVESIKYYTDDSTVHVPLQYESDFIIDAEEGIISRITHLSGFAKWPLSPGYVTVTYDTVAAFDVFDESDIPADLKLAAIKLVDYYKDEEYKQSKTIMGTSVVHTMSKSGDFPTHIKVLLDRYKVEK